EALADPCRGDRAREGGEVSRPRLGDRDARRPALRAHPQGAEARRRPRRRARVRRPLLREERLARAEARLVQAELHAEPQRPRLDGFRGARMSATRFFGKFRGTVVNNVDPLQIGRLQVLVPDVSNLMLSSWALPCTPIGGMQYGMFTVPLPGSGVWVEFEQGDPDYPVWVGCFWGTAAEVPTLSHVVPPATPGITLQTTLQNGMVITDVPGPTGGIGIKSASGAPLAVNDTGIYIQNGKGASIVMVGPTVTVNQGALVVT